MKNITKTIKYSTSISLIIFVIERLLTKNGFAVSFNDLLLIYAIHFLYTFVITVINFKLFAFIDSLISWKKNPKKRLIYGAIGSISITMLAIVLLRLFVITVIEQGNFNDFLQTNKSYYIFSFILIVNILITVHAIYFFKALTNKKVQEHKVISKTETAKFESLKNQLDPHFLFNSLNVLTALIHENPKQAEKFTTKLSKIYRYVLQQKNQDLIEVTQELQFAKTYMDLLKIRFENAIDFIIPEDLDNDTLKIVPLSLQLLLENAVKHNVISPNKKLKITIYKEHNYLVIENNINPKNNLANSTKIGLNNIIERYALVTSSKVIITNNQQIFTVKLPILTKKTTIMHTSNNQDGKYFRAQQKVKSLKEFYGSLISFIFVIPMLYFIWRTYTPGIIQWFWFPFLGWGFGLVMQALQVFGLTSGWENKKIKEFMDQENGNNVRF